MGFHTSVFSSFFIKQKAQAVLMLLCILLASCSGDTGKRELTPEDRAERARLYKLQQAREEAEEKATQLSLYEANDAKLKEILADCRQQINNYADRRNKGPFANHMIDIYSADVYQYPAGPMALKTDEERIQSLRKRTKDDISLNTSYAILSTSDSFNGPQKSVDKYQCVIEKGPKVARVKKSYF